MLQLYFLILASTVFTSFTAAAQVGVIDKKGSVQLAHTINHDQTLKKVHLENEQFLTNTLDGGGSLDGYFSKGKLSRIHCFIGYSFGTDVKDFYFRNDKLFYVHHTSRHFAYDQKSNTYLKDSLETPFIGHYYFRNGRLDHYDISETGHHFESEKADIQSTVMDEATEWSSILKR